MTTLNHITQVAIVGAGGNIGRFITQALLETGKHTVSAITRSDSQNTLPAGVIAKKVDYNKHETLVEALKGQDALIITLSGYSSIKETEEKLVIAAADAGVPWILPNEWSPDTANEELVKDVFIFQPKVATRKVIEDLGKSSSVSVVTGFWYEYTLANPAAYGFDFANRTVTFFDEGEAKISTSTWPQIGRAVAALLSLAIKPESGSSGACLEKFKNTVVYVNSFNVSQKDMLASIVRVTDTKEDDWTITKEVAQERYSTGLREIQEGKKTGFAKIMYTRVFYSDGCGDFEHNKGTLNGLLGLPNEHIDEATRVAIDRSKTAGGH